MTNRFIKIGAAAELLGVSIDTLRKWELSGELIPDRKVKLELDSMIPLTYQFRRWRQSYYLLC
jgi:MerR family regulatory protein.